MSLGPWYASCPVHRGMLCVDLRLVSYNCFGNNTEIIFFMRPWPTQMRQISVASSSFALCLSSDTMDPTSDSVLMNNCKVDPSQQFQYDKNTGHMKLGNRCLEVEKTNGASSPFGLRLTQCSFSNVHQEWRFREWMVAVLHGSNSAADCDVGWNIAL